MSKHIHQAESIGEARETYLVEICSCGATQTKSLGGQTGWVETRDLKLNRLKQTLLKRLEGNKQEISPRSTTKIWEDGWNQALDKAKEIIMEEMK